MSSYVTKRHTHRAQEKKNWCLVLANTLILLKLPVFLTSLHTNQALCCQGIDCRTSTLTPWKPYTLWLANYIFILQNSFQLSLATFSQRAAPCCPKGGRQNWSNWPAGSLNYAHVCELTIKQVQYTAHSTSEMKTSYLWQFLYKSRSFVNFPNSSAVA